MAHQDERQRLLRGRALTHSRGIEIRLGQRGEFMTQQIAQTLSFRGVQRLGPRGVELVTSVQRHQVNVNMRHPEPLDHNANAKGGGDRSQTRRQSRGRCPQRVVTSRLHVKQVVSVTFWNEQQVAGIDVLQGEERNVRGIFKYDRLRNAASDDLAEDAWTRFGHGA